MVHITKDNYDRELSIMEDSIVAVNNYFRYVIPDQGNIITKEDIRYLDARLTTLIEYCCYFMTSEMRTQFQKTEIHSKAHDLVYIAMRKIVNPEEHNLTYKEKLHG